MQVISQQQLANKNKTGHQYLTLDRIHIQEVELAWGDQINNDLIAVQIMLEIIQVTSYLLEVRTSKIKLIKLNSIINRWINKIKIHLKSKWLLLLVIRFISKLLSMQEIILIIMEIKSKGNKISWRTKNY